MRLFAFAALFTSLCLFLPTAAWCAEETDGTPFTVADGKIRFVAPKGWQKKQPSSRIVEVEFQIPAAKGDENPGRLTVMGAGGDVQANLDRWFGQFEQPDGSSTKDKAKVEEFTVAGNPVHYVDISGTYKDMPGGPFAGGKTIKREEYRMLAAIIQTKTAGNYFVKFYGPKATVAENEKAFLSLLKSLSTK